MLAIGCSGDGARIGASSRMSSIAATKTPHLSLTGDEHLGSLARMLGEILRPDQMAIVEHPAPIKVVAMGRRWGKTVTAGSLAVGAARLGGRVAWVAPTYRNGRPMFRFAEVMVSQFVKRGKATVNKAERTIDFRGAGQLGVFTAENPVSILGEAFDVVVIEEAARVPEAVWQETLMPTLADSDGMAMLISTPRGLNWFHTEWLRGQAGQSGYASWRAPSNDNPSPRIRRAYELARERLPEMVFSQEWDAQFLSGAGAVFRRVRDAATGQPIDSVDGRDYVMGIDLARVTDYTVCSVLDTGSGDTARQVHLDRFNRVDWEVQLDRLEAIAAKYRPRVVVVDRTGVGDMPYMKLAERLARVSPKTVTRGIRFSNANKMAMVQDLARGFEQGQLIILDTATPNGAAQFGELLAFEAQERATGSLTYNAPAGGHDDTVTALMLAWSVASPERMMTGRLSR